jgi:surface polysaccharide O-acyltransferase-like enzyme
MSDAENFSLFCLLIAILAVPAWWRLFFFPLRAETVAPDKEERKLFFDLIRGVAIIAVIAIHASFFLLWYGEDMASATGSIMLNNLARFAIPIFLISSGILLRPWEEIRDKAGFYKRKFLRIFLPYLLIVTFHALYLGLPPALYLDGLFTGSALVPFYFITVLAQLYLLYPFLSIRRKSKYFLLASFLLGLGATIFFPHDRIMGIEPFVHFLFFFAYGIYLRDRFIGEYKASKTEMSMWFSLIILYVLLAFYLPEYYYNNRFFYGLAIFNVLYYYRDILLGLWSPLRKILIDIGQHSLWLFLIHFYVERQIYLFLPDFLKMDGRYFLLIIPLTVFISYGLARIAAYAYRQLLKAFGAA